MDLLILYSDSKRGDVVSLAPLLHEKGISFHPQVLPPHWPVSESGQMLHLLKNNTHWLFLVHQADFENPAFLFASGYSLAIHERCYFLDTEGAVPGAWKNLLTICQDFPSLVQTLEVEKDRWTGHLSRQAARTKLLEHGVEVSNTSFLEAVGNGDQATCELFLQAGFSSDLTNKKGVSILCLAVRAAHLSVLRLLLDHGADVNLRSKDRDNSPLMDAAAEGLTDIVAELIGRRADLTGLSRNGQNALVLAIGKGAQDIAGMLLDAGADPFVQDKLGMNACQYAQMLGRKEFLERASRMYPGRIEGSFLS